MNSRGAALPTALIAMLAAGAFYRVPAQSSSTPPATRPAEASDTGAAHSGQDDLPTDALSLVADYLDVDVTQAGIDRSVRAAADLLTASPQHPLMPDPRDRDREAAANLLQTFCALPFIESAPHLADVRRIRADLAARLDRRTPFLTPADRDTLKLFLRDYLDEIPQKAKQPGYQVERVSRDFGSLDLSLIRWQLVTAKRVARSLNLKSLVVTAPDPFDSYVGWVFDPFLDALRRAVEAHQYVMDRFEIPDWTPGRGPHNASRDAHRDHETKPGLVLFRHARRDNDLLLVLIVTETPTAGLHRQAFQHAVQFVRRWTPADPLVRVVGPSFSGTVPSLVRAIEDARQATGATFDVTTGVATASGNRRVIEKAATFSATIHDKSTLFRTARRFLRDRVLGADEEGGSRYALLKESNTAYGQAAFGPASSASTFGADEFDQALQVSFPMHISRLHAAGQEQTAAAQARPFGAPSVRPLALDDGRTATDQLPTLWPALAESATELMVNNVLQTVGAERVRAVGIVATDPRDTLFLTQQLAQIVPNTIVYGMESDLLLTHPDFGVGTRGMVLITTYPLYNRNQVWSYPGLGRTRREMFYSSTAQGLYNAVTLQLNASLGSASAAGAARSGGRDGVSPLLDYATPLAPCDAGCAPPVWITVVGRNGLWPVRVYAPEAPASGPRYITAVRPPVLPKSANAPARGFAAPMWVPGWVSGCAAGLLLVILIHGAAFFWRPRQTSAGLFCTFSMPSPLAEHPAGTAKYLAGCFGALLVLAMYIASLFWTWAVSAEHDTLSGRLALWLGTPLILSTLVLVSGAVTWLSAAMVGQERAHLRLCVGGRDRGRRLAQTALRGLIVIVAATALFAYIWFLVDAMSPAPDLGRFTLDQVNSVLWFEQSVNVLNGVAPTLPVLALAAALYLWGVQGLRRRVDPRDVKLNERFLVVDDIALFQPDRGEKRRVAVARLVAVVVVTGIYLASLRNGIISFEGRAYSLMYYSGALLMMMHVTAALVSLCFQWRLIAARLHRFQDHPLLNAYRRLPAELITPRNLIQTPRLDQVYPLADRARRLAAVVTRSEAGRLDFTGTLARQPEFERERPTHPGSAAAGRVWEAFSCESAGCGTDTWTASRTYRQSKLLVKSLVSELRPVWDASPRMTRAGAPLLAAAVAPGTAATGVTNAAISVRASSSGPRIAPAPAGADVRVLPATEIRLLKEEIVALHVAFTLREVFAGLSGKAVFCLSSVFLLLASHTVFPFEPHRTLVSLAWMNVLVVITIGTMGLFGLERDPLLRCMSGANDGDAHGTATLIWRVLVFAVIPFLSLLAVEFPEISTTFIKWLEPMQRAL